MLTRLKVRNFKNLVDVDVRFGPFTCIAGANAVGKSNLFDAIGFLSALSRQPLLEASFHVRDEEGRGGDLRRLFHSVGETSASRMEFEAEMIVPAAGTDDLGQAARASITFLRYSLAIGYREDQDLAAAGGLEVLAENLVHINLGDAPTHLPFQPTPDWRRSVVHGARRGGPFISTEGEGPNRQIKRRQDGTQGRATPFLAATLPRTVLSVANAAESPTALLARREMQSWQLLQLEPSALRRPDDLRATPTLGADGSHLAATLYRLARGNGGASRNGEPDVNAASRVYARLANRLSQLIDDVYEVGIDVDPKRELLTLEVTARDGTVHPARFLSDGTLRFLALAVIEMDPEAERLLCLEEPENGVHPERIPAILQLLREITADVTLPIAPDNPLRQVIVNTHSPAVVSQVGDDSLLMAELKEMVRDGRRFKGVAFSCLSDTWRARAPDPPSLVSRGKLLSYLNPVLPWQAAPGDDNDLPVPRARRFRRVIDRPDLQPLLPEMVRAR